MTNNRRDDTSRVPNQYQQSRDRSGGCFKSIEISWEERGRRKMRGVERREERRKMRVIGRRRRKEEDVVGRRRGE